MDSAKTTYTIIPSPTLEKLEPALKENNIEYELISEKDVPEDIPLECTWHGHLVYNNITCIKSSLDPAKLAKFNEELHTKEETPDFSLFMA